jgi:putative phage-type endonuclease
MSGPRILAKDVDKMTRDEWLAVRRQGIGGSDAAAVCGVDPWRGPLSVWLSKLGRTPDKEPNESMIMGVDMEDTIAEIFSKRTGFKISRCNSVLQHAEYPFMLANIDRIVDDPDEPDSGVLECKNIGERMAEGWDDGKIPNYYQIQGMHYLAVTGKQYLWFAPVLGGNRMRPVKLVRDERAIKAIIKIESDFWDLVVRKVAPPIDGSPEAAKVLGVIYPHSTEESIEIEESLYDQLVSARHQRIDAELAERALENQIKEQMKEAGSARIPGNPKPVVTWRGSVTKRINVARMEEAEPEICAKYITESTSRRFLVR